jgi:hypothetical protein
MMRPFWLTRRTARCGAPGPGARSNAKVKPRRPGAELHGRSVGRPTAGRSYAVRRSSRPRRARAHSVRCGAGVNRLPTQPARRPDTGRPRSAPTGARFRTPAPPEFSACLQEPAKRRGIGAGHPIAGTTRQFISHRIKIKPDPPRMCRTQGVQHVLTLYIDSAEVWLGYVLDASLGPKAVGSVWFRKAVVADR